VKFNNRGIFTAFFLLVMVFISTPALAIKFDVWETGMSLAELVETAKANNIPITQAGTISMDSGFNQKFVNDGFWNASSVGYSTKLFGINSTVSMRMTPEQPRRLYEIEILMTGRMDKKKLYPELISTLIEKYGPPNKPKRGLKKIYQWTLNDTDQLILKLFSAPVLTYTDITYQKANEAKSGIRYKHQESGTMQNDADKL